MAPPAAPGGRLPQRLLPDQTVWLIGAGLGSGSGRSGGGSSATERRRSADPPRATGMATGRPARRHVRATATALAALAAPAPAAPAAALPRLARRARRRPRA